VAVVEVAVPVVEVAVPVVEVAVPVVEVAVPVVEVAVPVVVVARRSSSLRCGCRRSISSRPPRCALAVRCSHAIVPDEGGNQTSSGWRPGSEVLACNRTLECCELLHP